MVNLAAKSSTRIRGESCGLYKRYNRVICRSGLELRYVQAAKSELVSERHISFKSYNDLANR